MTEETKQPNTIHTTDKQYYVLKCMVQKIYSLIFGGSRCLMPNTLVLTSQGYKEIKDIEIGDEVPTLSKSGKIENKKVVNKFMSLAEHPKHKVIKFVFINNTQIICSYGHRFYFQGKFTKAAIIAKRAMESSRKQQRKVQSIKFWTTLFDELLCSGRKWWRSWYYEASKRCKWLFKNNDNLKWEEYDNKNAPFSSEALGCESRKQTASKSHKSYSFSQLCRELGMGYIKRKYRSHDECRSSDSKSWREKWNVFINRRNSKKYKEGIYSTQSNTKDVSGKVQLQGHLHKGCYIGSELEAREIDLRDIKAVEFCDYSDYLYDIEIEDNHNFFITKDNIISHNSGKSFIILLRMLSIASKHPCRQLVVRFHFTDVKKSVVLETLPKIAGMMGISYHLNQQDWFITIQNGTKEPSEIWFGGIDEGRGLDRILGKEYLNIWFNEASEITYNAYQTVITRLAQKVLLKDRKTGKQLYKQRQIGTEIKDGVEVPIMQFVYDDNKKKIPRQVTNRVFLDENPPKKSHWTYKLFFDHIEPESRTLLENPEEYGAVQVNPLDNSENIDESYVKRLNAMPPKLRTRFLLGNFADDISGALFTESSINRNRLLQYPTLKQVVISVDPATTSKSTSDETGIAVVGKCERDRGYLINDSSGILKPNEWADIAVKLFYKYDADCIVAEINQGGEMVKAVINNIDPNVPVKTVHATKGKMLRAEPISYLYEEDRISHVGGFTDAENEMTSFTGAEGEKSPNRLDAIVHGFTYLFPIGKSSDTEYFNREKVRFFDKYNMEDSESFGYVRITDADNYSFTMLCLKIKDKNIFVTDVLFNDFLPFDNLESVRNITMKNQLGTIYVECPKTHALFTRSVKNLDICNVRGINLESSEDNKILIESQFIREKFSFMSEPEDAQYKDFMRQLHGYTSVATKDEVFAPSSLAGISGIIKKMYRESL